MIDTEETLLNKVIDTIYFDIIVDFEFDKEISAFNIQDYILKIPKLKEEFSSINFNNETINLITNQVALLLKDNYNNKIIKSINNHYIIIK